MVCGIASDGRAVSPSHKCRSVAVRAEQAPVREYAPEPAKLGTPAQRIPTCAKRRSGNAEQIH